MKLLLILTFALFAFSNAFAQAERFVKPIDEAQKDASFAAFRAKLIDAANRRDAKYILSILDPKILLSYGEDAGIEDFKRMWKINSPQSEFWNEFSVVINNGGTFYKEAGANKTFWAPYTFNSFPEDLDALEYSTIFGNNVNLRAQPNTNAAVVASLSYNVVKVDYANSIENKNKEGDYLWLKVETLGGKKGFVKSEFVRSAFDYRAGFEKKNGKWLMTVFIAGD